MGRCSGAIYDNFGFGVDSSEIDGVSTVRSSPQLLAEARINLFFLSDY